MPATPAQLKPLKRHVDAVRKVWPEADVTDLQREVEGAAPVTYFAIDDGDGGDGLLGTGDTVRDAWADAARRIAAGLGYVA